MRAQRQSVLSDELDKPGYWPETIVLGANTDPYQPIERRQEITRDILTVLLERKHPVSITTKATSILRDLDILQKMAADNLVHVFMSAATLDKQIAGNLEPRAAAPRRRIEVREFEGFRSLSGFIVLTNYTWAYRFRFGKGHSKGAGGRASVVGIR